MKPCRQQQPAQGNMIAHPAVNLIAQLSGHRQTANTGAQQTDIKRPASHKTKLADIAICKLFNDLF